MPRSLECPHMGDDDDDDDDYYHDDDECEFGQQEGRMITIITIIW